MTDQPRKLIEVALPLDEINAACKADKDRKMGMLRNIHKWFAPMPLPAWRALIYAALIDDPNDDEKRAYHLDLIKRLVANGADLPDQDTLDEARRNIERQFPDGVPPVMDPFCGGGSTLVEAQRLGLPTYGSDLNPVPVLITRTLTELLPKARGKQPLHPETVDAKPTAKRRGNQFVDQQDPLIPSSGKARVYTGYDGLIRDVAHYAGVVGERAWENVMAYYPAHEGETPVAWLWARTARCPNPACEIETVLATSWWLDRMKGHLVWIEPEVSNGVVVLQIVKGVGNAAGPSAAPKSARGASFKCLGCGNAIGEDAIDAQSQDSGLGLRMTAVVSERDGLRHYRQPNDADLAAAQAVNPEVTPDLHSIPASDGGTRRRFGITSQADLYTPRQRLILSELAKQIRRTRDEVIADGGSAEWASAVVSVLGLALGRMAASGSSQTRWRVRTTRHGNAAAAFGRNDLPMMWDFAEANFRGGSVGDWLDTALSTTTAFRTVAAGKGRAECKDARNVALTTPGLVATDPPYFDAIGYADLSDYFYVWHRKALQDIHPDLYRTIAAPKSAELTALPARHGGDREAARNYFIEGFTETFQNLQRGLASGLPLLVVYASKEQGGSREEETRWSSILTAICRADLEITGTWPVHGTGPSRMIGIDSNAVATYVVMICRPRGPNAESCSLADFNRALRRELKPAVHDLQAAGILPVDLAQAAMGPGMQVYSRHRAVLDQSGERVPVEQALQLINQALSEVLDEQEGELDPDSRFAVTWWEKHHWADAAFGEADQLARPHGISVDDVIRAGVAIYPKPGFVRVIGDGGLDRAWMPSADARPTAWEAVHHLADRLIDGGGVSDAGALMGQLGGLRDQAQGLVYRLHAIAAKKGWTKDQERYNSLIGSWSDLLAEAGRVHGEVLF